MPIPMYRVYHKLERRLYHFVKSWELDYPDGVMTWTVWDTQEGVLPRDWKLKSFKDEEVIRMPWIGCYDHTLWADLKPWEAIFWSNKGYTELNWAGKPAFVNDIIRLVEEGKEDKLEVVKVDCYNYLCDSSGTVKDIPVDRDNCKIYVIGNYYQNPELLTDNTYEPKKRY